VEAPEFRDKFRQVVGKRGQAFQPGGGHSRRMTSARRTPQNDVQTDWIVSSGREFTTGSNAGPRFLSRMVGWWREFFDVAVPVGYEDETGFHYGDETANGN
jgi:hypothetical protein